MGNGPSHESLTGEEIDGHDVVVRFNDARLDGSLGQRTDVYVTTFRKGVRTSPLEMLGPGSRLATLSRADVPPSLEGQVDVWEDAAHALEVEVGCWPSSGLTTLFEAMRQRAERITLVPSRTLDVPNDLAAIVVKRDVAIAHHAERVVKYLRRHPLPSLAFRNCKHQKDKERGCRHSSPRQHRHEFIG